MNHGDGSRAYCADDATQILIQVRVSEVSNQPEAFLLAGVESGLCVSNHILLQHGPNVTASGRILSEDVLRAPQTTLFRSVPMELDSILELARPEVFIGKEHAQCLQNDKRATGIVISAGRSGTCTIGRVDAVEMAAYDHSPVVTTRDSYDYRLLREERMWKHLDRHAVLFRILDNIADLGEQPLSCLCTGLRLREPRVERSIVLDVLLDVLPVEFGNETLDVLLVLELLGIRRLLLYSANLGVEPCDIEEVAATAAVLSY